MNKFFLAPSILSADFARLGEDIKKVIDAGSDLIHFDVMDNHYVPNLSMGPMILESLRNYNITAPIDVHLMVKPVDNLIPQFAKAGATFITFHPEATLHIERTLNLIKENGCKAGLAFNPATPLNFLDYILEKLDLILLMSVNPGFGNQSFLPSTFNKLREVRKIIDANFSHILLEVDGGVKLDNIADIACAGANVFVMGSGLFKYSNYKLVIEKIRKKLEYAHSRSIH
ncbi:ribulose-phosphate 3-epimerase [Buchnera aphidicola]|uniref:ribulose-phosphate 3-epimerase n=1 Tax=Buchnera aphidicola TaxID=9 RepID=UPI000189C613|nr:ribulose-phosphate 3-epimerase [Buchnera aphidicola]ACL30327.1 ribulose-phosphate 3-epimerase [Buchnera aphidicola str. Tuc7 (Acyrthosiphon pisum)]ADP66341.1 ribulose-phosphate 3-epimerase [Buchnera aphidicola str. LL01 (Acyrthosiphon pisum)]ADP66915.1 ribulose-phosphate 3-epimerase [Buchnera aphidicola str. TLW03 (Acyrthosiphon pisum)]